jgi:hypothetical protein
METIEDDALRGALERLGRALRQSRPRGPGEPG